MADNKSGFKRHFPRVGKCCCCCNAKVSVTVCTIIITLWLGFGALVSTFSLSLLDTYTPSSNNLLSKITTILLVCVVISLIVLLVGLGNRNTKFMDQFKIVFVIYLIFQLCSNVYSFYLLNSDEYIKEVIKIVRDSYKNSINPQLQKLSDQPDEYFKESIKDSMVVNIVEYIIILAILIYYYLSTCSYIEDIEESAYEEKGFRDLENNEN